MKEITSLILIIFLLLLEECSFLHTGLRKDQNNNNNYNNLRKLSPEFEITPITILSQVGNNVTLPCRVRNLGEQRVSWIRTNDIQILTTDIFTFTMDTRFSVDHPDGDSVSWGLKLNGVKLEDNGEYECQINTFPKLRYSVKLIVKDSLMSSDGFEENVLRDSPPSSDKDISIQSPSPQDLQIGSVTYLICILENLKNEDSGENYTPAIKWSHNGIPISYSRNHSKTIRVGYNLETEISVHRVISRLVLSNISINDNGLYECNINDHIAQSFLQIGGNGQSLEAIQDNNGGQSTFEPFKSSIVMITLCMLHLAFIF